MVDQDSDESDGGDENNSRGRGILSQADRALLADPSVESDMSPQGLYQRREAIRSRVVNGIRDFWLLANELDDDEIGKIVDGLEVDGTFHALEPAPKHLFERGELESFLSPSKPDEVLAANNRFHHGVVSTVAFLYRLYGDDLPAFEKLVSDGVGSALQHFREGDWRVDVDIDPVRVEPVDHGEMLEKLESGNPEELTDKEREILVEHLVEEDAIDIDGLRMPKTSKLAWKPVSGEGSGSEGDGGDQ